ncbi:MAG TPA: phenylalanine--tRNA ligase subunit beta, partial [Alphaproteobacteria bacterium]
MRVPLSWLKDHIETDAPAAEIAARATALGIEVEKVEDRAKELAPFVVGYVEEAWKHPNADRLQLCRVNTGAATVQVVCGAPNARTGMKGVFAAPGTLIPGTGAVLKAGRIRGEDSNGMLCSEKELGLSDDHEGIIELAADAPVGSPASRALGLEDPVLEVALTPNRADCAGMRGIARDLAAAGLGTLKPLEAEPVQATFQSPLRWRRDFPDGQGDACPRVVGRYFRNVKNGPSPQWLADRLRAIGLRPISALVDITNFVTFDLARPLHVFDADTIAGDLTMRFARAGETLGALDGRTYTLDPDMVVIADRDGVQAIGGVMGGEGSGCGEDTTNVFLEVALFDAKRIAATGRRLGIESDARYRFERGVDPTSLAWGTRVATRLILEICGGEASEVVSAGEEPQWQRTATLRLSRIAGLGGVHLPPGEPARILAALGFEVSEEEDLIRA